ncbi:hypothetical protein FHR92_000822 [Fontibacillus solani]|uniref:Uncharacterized protein n=1 Tax=Fontibacillus solani TaxID=1572857 RepID=A0A7W3SQV4_9BACL|nr:hypothetical protein [Fontibacillus solani]
MEAGTGESDSLGIMVSTSALRVTIVCSGVQPAELSKGDDDK